MVTEDFAAYGPYQTWYRIVGDLNSGKPPLLVLHGGPGCTHDYVDSFKGLAARGRAVIHYDQVGNGRSTHLRDKGADFWTPYFFKAELPTTRSTIWACARLITSLVNRGEACLARSSP